MRQKKIEFTNKKIINLPKDLEELNFRNRVNKTNKKNKTNNKLRSQTMSQIIIKVKI